MYVKINEQPRKMNEITVDDIMDVIESTVELYNSEYDAIRSKIFALLNSK